MPPDDFEPPRPTPTPKKSNWVRNIIVILLVLVLIGGIFYAWASVKHPEWFDDQQTQPDPADPDAPITPGDTDKEAMYKVIAFILGGGVLILIGYIIYRGWGKSGFTGLDTKKPVAPDKAVTLFKENFCLKNDIQAVYDKSVEAFVPANPRAITINDKVPYFHTATGDNFLLLEIEVREGEQQGLHTIIIPIDKGEEVIKQGYYRQDTHTPRFQFNLQKINYPMSSVADKQDRLRLAMLDRMEGDPEAMRNLTSFQPPPQQPFITTPIDNYYDQEGRPLPPATRRPGQTNRRRRR